MIRSAIAATFAVLLLLTSAAHATTTAYRVTPLGSPYVWPTVNAATPKAAFIAFNRLLWVVVPEWAVIITPQSVCRSTYRIVGGGVTRYGYDVRSNDRHC